MLALNVILHCAQFLDELCVFHCTRWQYYRKELPAAAPKDKALSLCILFGVKISKTHEKLLYAMLENLPASLTAIYSLML